jgi:hypothetical protein
MLGCAVQFTEAYTVHSLYSQAGGERKGIDPPLTVAGTRLMMDIKNAEF